MFPLTLTRDLGTHRAIDGFHQHCRGAESGSVSDVSFHNIPSPFAHPHPAVSPLSTKTVILTSQEPYQSSFSDVSMLRFRPTMEAWTRLLREG